MSDSTRKLLWLEIIKMLIAVQKYIYCVIYYNCRHTFVPCRWAGRHYVLRLCVRLCVLARKRLQVSCRRYTFIKLNGWRIPVGYTGLSIRVCPDVQFYTECAVIVVICPVLTAHLCSFTATPRTPLGELTALPRPPDWISGERK